MISINEIITMQTRVALNALDKERCRKGGDKTWRKYLM